MDTGIEGRVAFVTGASQGIGRAIAAGLAGEGARVAISSRSRDRIDAAAAEIGATGFVLDSQDLDAVPEVLAAVEQALGPIDILVCNTGGPPPDPDPLSFTREQWEAPTAASSSPRWHSSSAWSRACESAASGGS
jgi:3-oxoacyl-[acyl-carrier protein] reductase